MGRLPQLYSTLADWWPLLSSPLDYAEEAAEHWRVISNHVRRPVQTVLELGSGGGNNASHMKQWCRMTLADLSEEMLEVSKRLNPQCEHVQGDMRALRLGRRFDAVFVHDAIMYMRTRDDLVAVMKTAFEHCEPLGVALFVPDFIRETFTSATRTGGHDAADRALRYLDWTYDPDPADNEYVADMSYLLRDADGTVRALYDRHRFGLFDRATWLSLLAEAGFEPSEIRYNDREGGIGFIGFRGVGVSPTLVST